MRISYYCKSCKWKNFLKVKSNDRFELKQELGADEISLTCKNCMATEKRHLNRFDAEIPRWTLPACIVLAILATVLLLALGLIGTITFTIPMYLYFDAQKNVSKFNKTKLSRR